MIFNEELVDCFALLRSGEIVYFDENSVPFDIALKDDAIITTRRSISPAVPVRVLDVVEVDRFLRRRHQNSFRVNDLPYASLRSTERVAPPRLNFYPRRSNIGWYVVAALIGVAVVVFLLSNKSSDDVQIYIPPSAVEVRPTTAPPAVVINKGKVADPVVRAPMAIVIDATSGQVLFSKSANRRAPMASTTKIMTALTAINIPGTNLDEQYTVAPQDLIQAGNETNMGLRAGEVLTFRDLLYGMFLPSANDAARAVARYAGLKLPGEGDPAQRFVDRMNWQAAQFGLKDSHFVNPHGLDAAEHYSSAYDLAMLGKILLANPTLSKIVATTSYKAGSHQLTSLNSFLARYNGAIGIKTGFTDAAGYCLVAAATRNGKTVVSVIMGTDATGFNQDPLTLSDYAFKVLSP